MGGSGGGFFRGDHDPEDYIKKLRESEGRSLNQEFDIQVKKLLITLLAKYNDRDVDATQKHLDIIKRKLDSELESSIDLIFNGSVARHTYVDGFSDVDALLVIDKTKISDKSPQEVREYIGNLLQERLPKTEIKVGSQAITINFSDQKIQILPAIKHHSGYKISDESGSSWSHIKPKEFATKLTKVNSDMNGKLVPTIKLAKSIIAQNPITKISGYHAEALAIDIFKNYAGEKNTKTMLKYFFEKASNKILKPINDSTGKRIEVDNHLGESNSLQRRIISNSIERIFNRMSNADGAQSVDNWSKILGSNE